MPATTWELNLKGNAPTAAKRAAREVAALVRVLRDLKDVAPGASRALGGVVGAESIRNLRTQVGLTKELGRELRKNNAESRRGRSPGFGGRTRTDGLFSQQEQARLRAMGDRRRSRDAAADARARRQSEQGNRGYFQRQSRMTQQSFRENERLRAGQRRTEQQRQRAVDRSPGMGSFLAAGGRGASAIASGLMSVVGATLSAVVAIAGLAAGFAGLSLMIGGALLQMISFRESTLMTLSTLMRVPGEAGMSPQQRTAARGTAARDEFRWASQFARETPLDTQQVVGLRRQAATSGYQGVEARRMTSAAADAGALRPDDPTAGSRFLLQMGQLRNSSRARSADYRPAAQAAGVNEQAAMRRAAIAAGVVQRSGEADPAYQRRVDQAQGNGQITGRQMHDAILAEQNSQLGQTEHGAFARSQSGSLAATLSNLGEGFQAFVTSIEDIENLPGILALKAMLRDVAAMLAGTTNNGKALQALFAGLVNDAAGFLGTAFGPGGFDGALSSVLAIAKELWPIVRGVALAFKDGFMEGFGPFLQELRGGAGEFLSGGGHDLIQWAREFGRGLAILGVWMLRITALTVTFLATGVAGIGPLNDFGEKLNRLRSLFQGLADPLTHLRLILSTLSGFGPLAEAVGVIADFFGIGENMGRGVAAGFRSQQGHMQREISSVMASLPATARTDMQIKSPSRVMAEIGQYMAEGVTVGLDSGAGGVQSAMSSVVAPPSLPGLSGGLRGMGAPSISVVVQVQGGASAEETGTTIGERLEEMLLGTFGRMQLAGGD